MHPRPQLIAVLLTPLLLLLSACGDGGPPPQSASPGETYQRFYNTLIAGETDKALDGLAPRGALGNTFKGGSYFMEARELNGYLESRGSVDKVMVDDEQAFGEEEVMVYGRIVFKDGSELRRSIRFTREDNRWVGHL